MRETEQTCPVMPHSIVASIGSGNCDCNHLPMYAAEFARSMHGCVIEPEMRLKNIGCQAMDPKNVRKIAGLLALLRIAGLKVAVSLTFVNGFDRWHALAPATP